ncbi:hypothetical protein BDV25DRAFT_163290 [Aspergillus avenaceus]|uniref:Uncharacterized protein n=1 Tax=Aspergillus avenaceus TaxID=36643 RepID=A0A5N6TI60_ASPAV|nr:hypothetical protein BDV25DRAFT_163290 [Aspergillus avenaceus]
MNTIGGKDHRKWVIFLAIMSLSLAFVYSHKSRPPNPVLTVLVFLDPARNHDGLSSIQRRSYISRADVV